MLGFRAARSFGSLGLLRRGGRGASHRLAPPQALAGTAVLNRLSARLLPGPPLAVLSSNHRFERLVSTRSYAKEDFLRDIPDGSSPIPIAIIGRPNVGKSTLFNRLLSGTTKKKEILGRNAIVSNRAGTTRDRKDAVAVFGGLLLRVIDTGGLESDYATQQSTLLTSIERHVFKAVSEAAAVLFVIDAREGITPLDQEISERLLKYMTNSNDFTNPFTLEGEPPPVILIANKAEGAFMGPYLNDCYELNLGDPVLISAYHNEGMEELYDRLSLEVGHLQEDIDADAEAEEGEEEFDYDEGEEEEEPEVDAGIAAENVMAMNGSPDVGISGGANGTLHVNGMHLPVEEEAPTPTLKWMPPVPLTEKQKEALRWYAHHPADPLGELDEGLKASVLHKAESTMPDWWLGVRQKNLRDVETRDFVLKHRRLEERERPLKIAMVGQPNSGKSSIINALLQEDRCIVDDANGTTMDAIVSDWTFKNRAVKLIDTCGIYRGWHYPGSHDLYEPGMGTRKAIRRANVVVLCIDATRELKKTYVSVPTQFEMKLARYISEEGRCLVVAMNKWDLVEEDQQAKFRAKILERIADGMWMVKGVPVVFMSAKYNLNLSMLITRCLALSNRWSCRLPTRKLNDWLRAWLIRWPPPWRRGKKCSVKYITQTRARPPTFVVWTNTTADEMPPNYLSQMKNGIREEFRISGVPLRFVLRTTLMPKPRKKMTKSDILKWKRLGPKQAEAVADLNSKKQVRVRRQTE